MCFQGGVPGTIVLLYSDKQHEMERDVWNNGKCQGSVQHRKLFAESDEFGTGLPVVYKVPTRGGRCEIKSCDCKSIR